MTTRNKLDALKGAFDKKGGGGSGGDQSWKLFYSFWKMPEDATATFRFLPDQDEDNSLQFLVEKLEHELIINGEKKRIPCATMFGEECPICALSRSFYDAEDEVNGKKFYRKKSYIGQGIVVDSPIEHDQNQLVKLIEFGPALFKQMQAAFKSGDLEEVPYDLNNGYNFRIKKTKNGQYASYTTSSFSPKPSALDDDVIAKINLFNLSDFRGQKMDRAVMEALLLAAQTGQAYSEGSDDTTQAAPPAEPAPQAESAPAPTAAPAPEAQSTKTSSVLEQLRERAKAAANNAG